MSAVEKAAEVLAAHARCYPNFWGGRWNFVCGVAIKATDVRGSSGAHRAHVAQALADAGLLIAAFPDGSAGTLTGDLLTDMAAYAGRLKDRTEAAEWALATLREDVQAACAKAEVLTQDVMGVRSQHWRGQDYADGLDAGIETTAGLVREAIGGTR